MECRDKKEIEEFIVLANRHHPTIKFTAEISDKEINFLDNTVFKGERFNKQAILDIIVTRGTGYETLQVPKAITKVLQFMLKVLRPCTIFCFTFAHYG